MQPTLPHIEEAIRTLPRETLNEFDVWYTNFIAGVWDEQFEEDVKAGKLDKLAAEAVKDFKAGKCIEL